jgi:hypothetical protein
MPHHVALSQPHLVGERVDDFVVHQRHAERLREAGGDVLAERAHLPGHCDERHYDPPDPASSLF